MNRIIKYIIDKKCSDKEKNKALDLLSEEIDMARGILSGEFKYCPECDDYYLTKSYLEDRETKPTRICIYEDLINSGGNDYVDGFADITYSVCPKGHRNEVDRKERRK